MTLPHFVLEMKFRERNQGACLTFSEFLIVFMKNQEICNSCKERALMQCLVHGQQDMLRAESASW